jgi:murein L,D-transpeptidase YcbB/YkuD
MFHPSRRDTCFVTLLRLDARAAVVAAGDADLEAPLSQVDALWTRDAVLFWPEPPEARRDSWARETLASLGYAEPDLAAAVARFQKDADLVPDGLLGSRTRMALFARAPGERPRLAPDGGRP